MRNTSLPHKAEVVFLRFVCPLCQSPLMPERQTWRCDGSLNSKKNSNNETVCHPFDVARQGYVNLLPVQQKKSKAPGDSQDSVLARQRFLATGSYQKLQQTLCEQAQQLVAESVQAADAKNKACDGLVWLDVGCGEGYYTHAIAETLRQSMPAREDAVGARLIAIDISKPAVSEYAKLAKQAGQLYWQSAEQRQGKAGGDANDSAAGGQVRVYPVVASAAQLPLAESSVDVISSVFSPILPDAFERVLKAGGYVVIAKPDVGHLRTLREGLFEQVQAHDSEKFVAKLAGFELVTEHRVCQSLSLAASELADLLTMTPYSYRAKRERREALLEQAQEAPFQTTAQFVVYVFKKLG